VDSASTVEKKGSPRVLSMSAASSVSSDEVSDRRKSEDRALSSWGHERGRGSDFRGIGDVGDSWRLLATLCDSLGLTLESGA
jgi:hypothetical protein